MNLSIKGGKEPGRNEPCPCKSELKYKHCHGDMGKRAVCERVMQETMCNLIMKEKHKRGLLTNKQYELFLHPKGTEKSAEESRIINPFEE